VLPRLESGEDGADVATLESLPGFLDSEFAWEFRALREVRTVREDVDDPIIFDPRAVLELGNGSLLVHDPVGANVFVLLDEAGAVVRRFGQSGQGPGEFGVWVSLSETAQGFAILDSQNRQVHLFDATGSLIERRSFVLDGPGGKTMPAAGIDAFYVEVLRVSDIAWHRELVRVEATPGTPRSAARLPEPPPYAEPGRIQRGRVVWTVLAESVVAMWSDRPEVSVYDVDGAHVRTIHLPMSPRVLTERDIQDQVEHYGGIARSLTPGPAALTNELYAVGDSIFGMFTTELWKSEDDPDLEVGRVWWRLFTARGEYVGVVALPEDFWPLGRSSRGVWARVFDEAGNPVIRELELVRERAGNLQTTGS
jgi:hypothetical protein